VFFARTEAPGHPVQGHAKGVKCGQLRSLGRRRKDFRSNQCLLDEMDKTWRFFGANDSWELIWGERVAFTCVFD
jgi:hypothetical protein